MSSNLNLKTIGDIYKNTKTPYPTPVCCIGVEGFEQPFHILLALNSTTGRHGSGKTRLRYRKFFQEDFQSQAILPTSTAVIPFMNHPGLLKKRGVVLGTSPLLVRDLDTLIQVELREVSTPENCKQGCQIEYYSWTHDQQQINFYY